METKNYTIISFTNNGLPAYGKWEGVRLSEDNKKQFYVPEGFAHGFLVLSNEAEFTYKCTDFYDSEDEEESSGTIPI